MPGYSGTPLATKLGYKAGTRAWLHAAPQDYLDWLQPLPEAVRFETRSGVKTGLHHLFVTERKLLAALLLQVLKTMPPDAAIWVSWPKKSAKIATEITEQTIRDVALPMGLVDIKVCAVSEIWSGLKLVLRKELRGDKV